MPKYAKKICKKFAATNISTSPSVGSLAAISAKIPLKVELWSLDCQICKAKGPDPIPVQYWVELLADELDFTQTVTSHGVITQGHFLCQFLEPHPSETLITKIAPLSVLDTAIKAGTLSQVICTGPRWLQHLRIGKDNLQIHVHTKPTFKSTEPLKFASVSAKEFWLAAAALGSAPSRQSPAGRFYSLFYQPGWHLPCHPAGSRGVTCLC